MSQIHYGVCNFCDAICGLEIEYEGDKVLSIRGDKQDAFSRGHICPKGMSHPDLHNDPDRLRRPVRRKGDSWEEISWEEALDEAGKNLAAIQKKYGNDALGAYYGNPAIHATDSLLGILPFIKGLRSRNIFSVISVDSLTRMLVSLFVYGNQAILPVPDIERTDYLLVVGSNPVVSNGSVMTAPDCKKRLMEIRERGGKIVVVDPRRNETAEIADEHYFIRPGTDAFFYFAMLHTIFSEKLVAAENLYPKIDGMERLKEIASEFPAERVSNIVGIEADKIKKIARDFAKTPRAVSYGRMGICCQEFGSMTSWLADAMNIAAGKIDRVGCAMFCKPAVDLVRLSNLIGERGFFNRYKSRVGGLPEFNGELPSIAMAEEMETPGPGQIKGFITLAGNPLLSLPNGKRLERAFENLEYFVAIDIYINETTRLANLILPPVSTLENWHYPILEHSMGVRNTAHYSPAMFPTPEGAKNHWEIIIDLLGSIDKHCGGLTAATGKIKHAFFKRLTPERQVKLLLKLGPHKLSLDDLKKHPHGIDLGPLEPRLDEIIGTRNKKINLVPKELDADIARLRKKFDETKERKKGEFLLSSRRTLRSNNSWMHNIPRLALGKSRCVLLMNPKDAEEVGCVSGGEVEITSRTGSIVVTVEVTDEIMPGVVSYTFGWGHNRKGARLSVASASPGVSMNDVTDDKFFDAVSGIASFHGVPVTIRAKKD